VVDEQKPVADEATPAEPDADNTATDTAAVESASSAATASDMPAGSDTPPVTEVSTSDAGASESVDDDDTPAVEAEEEEFAEWADDDDVSSDEELEDAAYESEDMGDVAPLEEITDTDDEPAPEDLKMDWYILKVQSNREDSIAAALTRRVKIAGFEKFFDEIIVPVEMITEFKAGKRRVVKRKLYPGYIVVHMAINDETWFLVRETPGIGDFTGSAGRPTPMLPQEVSRIVKKDEDTVSEEPKLQIGFRIGDQVKINEGTFENFEGEVESVDATSGRVTVMINIFGRSTPVELEHWQIEAV